VIPIPLLPGAQEELLEHALRYRAESPSLAAAFLDEVERAVARISTFPEHGSPYLAGTRRVVLRRFPFSVVYSREAEGLLVVAIAHQHRRPGYWRDRV
jgi:plasmid stabilization system protein ParE